LIRCRKCCDARSAPRASGFAVIAFLLILPVIATGCTSKPFQYGVSKLGPVLANEAADYAGRDPNLPEIDRAVRMSQAMKLKAQTSDANTVTLETTEAAWNPVKPWLGNYSESDPLLLMDPAWLALRREEINSMDGLISAERLRRSLLFPLTPATQPVH
jgi:hypothetical protein